MKDPAVEALLAAIKAADISGMRAAFAAGATLTTVLTPGGSNALQFAAWHGIEPVVQFLIAEGAELDAARPDGTTALIAAAQNGHAAVAQALLGAPNIEVNKARTDVGGVATPLFVAAQNGHLQVADTLR